MLLHHSRRDARVDDDGELVLLGDQDRTCWHADEIAEGTAHVAAIRREGPYAPQAAIAFEHVAQATDWRRVVGLYGRLAALQPSPVVELNRAVAVAMAYGPEAGLRIIEDLNDERLASYHLLHAARADMLRRMGRAEAAREAYQRARELAANAAERAFLERRLAEL